MKRIVLPVLSILLVIAAFCPGDARADESTTKKTVEKTKNFRVEEANLKLGKITAGKDAVGTFVFHNGTDHDVKIIRAKPS